MVSLLSWLFGKQGILIQNGYSMLLGLGKESTLRFLLWKYVAAIVLTSVFASLHPTSGSVSQIAELSVSGFNRLQVDYPDALHSKVSGDCPILIAFDAAVGNLLVDGELPACVLPPGGLEALKLPEPTLLWHALDPHDGSLAEGDDDGSDNEVGGQARWRYPWPCPLHICRLAPHLKSLDSLKVVLEESAAVLVGPAEAFVITDNLESSVPVDRTIAPWQVKMDFVTMLYDRWVLANTDNIVDRHLGGDGSPIAGFRFLCLREETFTMTRGTTALLTAIPLSSLVGFLRGRHRLGMQRLCTLL